MKHRKKPVVVEVRGPIEFTEDIVTLEGVMRADVGDYIITGVKGEHYPCKPDIFEATYEPALDTRERGGTVYEMKVYHQAGRWRWVMWHDNELANQGDEATVEQASIMAAGSIVAHAQRPFWEAPENEEEPT